jgi:hypothetical protein
MRMETTVEKITVWRHDRVRANTAPEVNERLDQQTILRLRLYAKAGKELIAERLEELDREWDMERTLEANAASVTLAGLVFGKIINRAWYLLPVLVGGFLMQHAVQGFCPPVLFFRRRGVRTRKEIERERYALKLLRGDFDSFHSGEKPDINRVLEIIDLA